MTESTIRNDLAELLKEAQTELHIKLQQRMDAGEREYGQLAFMERDTMDELMEEVADIINWGTFVYLKMYMVKRAYAALAARKEDESATSGFITMKDLFGRPMG